ncbi:transporter substrate-binding domain-containing protein [Chloroflexota bacterium]
MLKIIRWRVNIKYITWIWIALLLFLLVASALTCSEDEVEDRTIPFSEQESEWLAAHPVIRVAPDPDFPPIEYFDENGEFKGVAADYVELVSQKLGIDFEIVHLRNWDEAIEKLKSKQIDMLSAVVKTLPRTEYMLFTFPYVELPAVIIVEKSVKETLTLEKLSCKKVAVVAGMADYDLIAPNYPELDLDPVPDIQTGLQRVSFGTVDAFVLPISIAVHHLEKEGITNLRIAGETDYTVRLAFGSRNDWPELNLILEKGLSQISEEEKQVILTKWIRLEQE